MISVRVAGVTCNCSSVPRSRSRTIALAVNWMSVNVRMIAISPGMMKLAVFSSGLYQGRTRRSIGREFAFQPARCARIRTESPLEMPAAIDMAWLAVVVSEALTMSSAFAGAPRWMSLPKSRSITRPTEARAPSIQRRSSSRDPTEPTTSKYSVAVIFATSSRLSYVRASSRTTVFRCLTS